MRIFLTLLLASGTALGQAVDTPKSADAPAAAQPVHATPATAVIAPAQTERPRDANALVIPAGAKIPLTLAQAISTKNAREGDAVYATTAFPFVINDRILVPAGTYIQGKIMHTEKAGRAGSKRAEILIHFTSMIYPTGYTVMLPGSIDNTPGADNKGVKDSEGTIQQDSNRGQRVEDAAKGAAVGATVGSVGGLAAGGLNGARYGGLAGIAGGVAWALLKHGPDVKLDIGTSIEMQIQRDVKIDATRIQVAKAQ